MKRMQVHAKPFGVPHILTCATAFATNPPKLARLGVVWLKAIQHRLDTVHNILAFSVNVSKENRWVRVAAPWITIPLVFPLVRKACAPPFKTVHAPNTSPPTTIVL